MSGRSRALLTAALLASGCAGLEPGPLLLHDEGPLEAQARDVAVRAQDADIVYLGEQHDNPAHHERQRHVLEALVADGTRPIVAFEMLDQGQQPALEQALAGSPTAEDLAARLHWRERGWPDFAMYWPLFALAKQEQLGVVATDLEPALVRRISRDGLEALGPRGAELASLLQPDAQREAAIARTIRDAHCGLLPEARLPFMVQAWHARNVTMARRLAAALDDGARVVMIVGRGHQEPGGVPDQLAVLRPRVRQLVVDMREAASAAPGRGRAARRGPDIVWLTPAVERPDPCEPLRRRTRTAASESGRGGDHWPAVGRRSGSMLVMRR